MASNRLNRSMRGVLAATAVATAVGVTTSPAVADPAPPANSSDAAKQLHDLSAQAEVLTEQYKKAEDDHAARINDVNQATAQIAQAQKATTAAKADEDKWRVQSDRFVSASFEGARVSQMSVLLTSKNPQDYLDGASALDMLAKQQADVLAGYQSAIDRAAAAEKLATDAKNRAAQAEADAARLEADAANRKHAADAQVAKAQAAYNALSASEKKSLDGGSDSYSTLAGSGAAIEAVNAALSRIGDPYVWGATGPNQFDCSGLTQWAYKQAGVSLPRSTYSQIDVGQSVSESELQPGDLIFFNSDSHVGMYIGGGKVVHAPTEGENVKITQYKYIGTVSAMRRVAG